MLVLLKKISSLILSCLILSSVLIGFATRVAAFSGADFRADRIMDDSIFFDSTTMGAPDIQAFLNSKVPVCDTNGTQPYAGTTRAAYAASRGVYPPFICLKDYRQDIPTRSPDQYCSGGIGGGNKSAAEIIKDVSVACSVNPKVIIILLQKEQSLITDDWPWPVQYRSATGFGCPDTAACDTEYYGFFNQVYYGARQYQRYARQPEQYSYRSGRSNFIQYNPNAGCGGSDIFIQNQATAGLYNYTPYQPNAAALANLYGTGDSCSAYGNRNFWRMYSDWFGSTLNDHCLSSAPAPIITDVTFRKFQPGLDSGNFIIYSGSSTNCIESHTWGVGFRSWQNNAASNQPVVNPATGLAVKYADLSGDGKDEPILVATSGTGSGKVEFHVWDYSMKKWVVHAVSNLSTTDAQNYAIEFADTNGDGKDEPVAIKYKNTASQRVEFYYWVLGIQNFSGSSVTNLPAPLDPNQTQIGFADLNADGKDEAIALGVGGTSTGKFEFHIWAPGEWAWQSHIVSNQTTAGSAGCGVKFGDLDGDRIDNGVLVCAQSTSTGRIEFHVWNPGLSTWQGHYVSNQQIL